MRIDAFSDDATTKRTHKNIEKTLRIGLKEKYNLDSNSITQDILKIHGLTDDDFDVIKTYERLFNEKLNDVSIDANANKNDKTIRGLQDEAVSSTHKAVGYDYLYRVMKEIYGKKEAKRLSSELYDFSLAISDSTKILVPYCWSFDASKLVIMGRPFGQLQSTPPNRVGSYIAALGNVIHQMSNHLAGAIAIGTFFLDLTHILIYKEKRTLEELKSDVFFRKNMQNNFQKFVHDVNDLSRSGVESPFTNISIFDKVKLQNFLTIDNYSWYFDGIILDNGETDINYRDYVVDFIMELQKIFLEFFNKGDPSKNGVPYRFPIVTLNISKKSTEKIEDNEFVSYITKLDISKYNIFVSEGNKVSSCCRLLSDLDMLNLAGQVNSFGGGSSVSLGSHRVVTINFNRIALECENIDHFYNILDNRIEDCAKILKAHKQLIEITTEKNLQLFIKMGWIDLKKMFSTFGMLGEFEAIETLQTKFKELNNKDILYDILVFLNKKVSDYSKKYEIIGNIEQIPGESMAIKLCNADKILFTDSKVKYSMYSNQFIPLWEDVSIWKRMELDGRYTKLLTGGGICHFTLGEKITGLQSKKIIKYAIECGCEHFALNTIYTECERGHITIGRYRACPNCNSPIREYYTRVVGFFTPVSSWNKVRREWEFDKRIISNGKDIIEIK